MARGYSDQMHRDRWQDDDRERSSYDRDRDEDRGFFERAGDEIRSWFGGEDDERRYHEDYRRGSSWDRDQDRDRPYSRSGTPRSSSWNDEGRGSRSGGRERNYGHVGRGGTDFRDRSYFGGMAQGGMDRSGSRWDRDENRGYGPSRGGGSWMSSGDRNRFQSNRLESRDRFRGEHGGRDHPQSWGEANRGENESLGYSEYRGTLGGLGNQTVGSSQDDHYRSWRDRQMANLDKDYDDYCREREQQFHEDFDSWRRNRQSQEGSSPETGSASNAGVGTTTASTTGTAGAGTAEASPTGTGGSIQADTTGSTETAGSGGSASSRASSRSRS